MNKLETSRAHSPNPGGRRKKGSAAALAAGIITVIFAIAGVVLTAYLGVNYLRNREGSKNAELEKYNKLLEPIAAVDPDAFDDISGADTERLLDAAIWSLLSADAAPDTYAYDGGFMLIPQDDVTQSYGTLFGENALSSLTLDSVQGYNYKFLYDASAGVYRIPITTIRPLYTPKVTDVEKNGETVVVTVDYVSAEAWDSDRDGSLTDPTPQKTMKVTFSDVSGSYGISSLRLVSRTIPETVAPVVTQAPAEAQTTAPPASTTGSEPVKTTLGGVAP